MMLDINMYSNQIEPDLLSLDEAVRIGMKNINIERMDAISLATYETKHITNIVSKYNNLFYQQECYSSIEKTKLYILKELRAKKIKPQKREEFNLHIQSIIVNIDVMLLKQFEKGLIPKWQLNEILGVSETDYFCLSTPFENVHTAFDPVLYGQRKKVASEIITNYNNQISILQQLSISKQLSKHQLANMLGRFEFSFTELQSKIENHISKEISYNTQLFELKEVYNMLLNLLVLP